MLSIIIDNDRLCGRLVVASSSFVRRLQQFVDDGDACSAADNIHAKYRIHIRCVLVGPSAGIVEYT